MRPLHSEITGRDYLLYVGYPDSYHDGSDRRYPVVYLTDGYWSFTKFYSLGSNLWYDKAAPEYIVVGLGYAGENIDYEKERTYELTPSKMTFPSLMGVRGEMGGAPLFLKALQEEIVPYIESQTRADPSFRVLAGNSLGGLFDLVAMYEAPGFFQGIIAGSPSVFWDGDWIFKRAKAFCKHALKSGSAPAMPTALYLTVGGEEAKLFQRKVVQFNKLLTEANYKGFRSEFRVIDGEGHGSSVAETFNRGIRFVFQNYHNK